MFDILYAQAPIRSAANGAIENLELNVKRFMKRSLFLFYFSSEI